jgi:hypothetical protein
MAKVLLRPTMNRRFQARFEHAYARLKSLFFNVQGSGKAILGYDTANSHCSFMPFMAEAGVLIALIATKIIVSGFFPKPLFLRLFDLSFEDL